MLGRIPFRVHGILLAALSVLSACTSTRLVNSWKNPDVHGPILTILVVGETKQSSIRRSFEDTLSAAIKQEGLNGVPSYRYIDEEQEVSDEKLAEVLKTAGANAVVITRLARLDRDVDLETSANATPLSLFRPRRALWGDIEVRQSLVEREVAYLETKLYDARSKALLWSAMTETQDPNYSKEQIDELVKVLAENLKLAQMLRVPRLS